MRNPAAIEFLNVWCSGGCRQSLRGLSLAVETGEIAAVVGPRGSGKTTVVELVLGWRQPSSGKVRVLGESPDEEARMLHYRVGTVLDPPGLFHELTAAENILYFAGLFCISYPSRAVSELLTAVGLDGREKTRAGALSLAERQALALARALVMRPEVLVMDEPLRGLDTSAVSKMWNTIETLAREGTSILLTCAGCEVLGGRASRVVMLPGEWSGKDRFGSRATRTAGVDLAGRDELGIRGGLG